MNKNSFVNILQKIIVVAAVIVTIGLVMGASAFSRPQPQPQPQQNQGLDFVNGNATTIYDRRQIQCLQGNYSGAISLFSKALKIGMTRRYAYPNQWPGDGEDNNLTNNATDLAELIIKRLDLGPAHLIVHSYGTLYGISASRTGKNNG